MKKRTTTATTDAPSTEQTRDCERCGRDRPENQQRFTITAEDFTDATAVFEKTHLCRQCWGKLRADLRRCFA